MKTLNISFITILFLLVVIPLTGYSAGGQKLFQGKKKQQLVIPALQDKYDSTANFVLIELFSSESCGSCPRAYDVAGKLLKDARENHRPLYLLDFHVDYWNDLDWKDPYSDREYTFRQNRYALQFNNTGLYTPQMIVNGTDQFVGAGERRAFRAVQDALMERAASHIRLKDIYASGEDSVSFTYETDASDKNLSINFAIVQPKALSHITDGDNEGMSLTQYNIVRHFWSTPLAGRGASVSISNRLISAGADYSLIVFVQDKVSMKIFAATAVRLHKSGHPVVNAGL